MSTRRDARDDDDAVDGDRHDDAFDGDVPDGYVRQTINLTPSHRWRAAPGHSILVLDAGAMRVEYPSGWRVIPKGSTLRIHDRAPPDDEGRFQITLFRLPPLRRGASWNDLPLDKLLHEAITKVPRRARRRKGKHRPLAMVHEVTHVRRPDLEYAWAEQSGPDPENGKMLFTRQVLARARGVQPLITFDYYASRADDYQPVWQHAMESLRLGAPVSLLGDPLN